MNDRIEADFIVESEEGDHSGSVLPTGWEDVVFQLEDESEWPWS